MHTVDTTHERPSHSPGERETISLRVARASQLGTRRPHVQHQPSLPTPALITRRTLRTPMPRGPALSRRPLSISGVVTLGRSPISWPTLSRAPTSVVARAQSRAYTSIRSALGREPTSWPTLGRVPTSIVARAQSRAYTIWPALSRGPTPNMAHASVVCLHQIWSALGREPTPNLAHASAVCLHQWIVIVAAAAVVVVAVVAAVVAVVVVSLCSCHHHCHRVR